MKHKLTINNIDFSDILDYTKCENGDCEVCDSCYETKNEMDWACMKQEQKTFLKYKVGNKWETLDFKDSKPFTLGKQKSQHRVDIDGRTNFAEELIKIMEEKKKKLDKLANLILPHYLEKHWLSGIEYVFTDIEDGEVILKSKCGSVRRIEVMKFLGMLYL